MSEAKFDEVLRVRSPGLLVDAIDKAAERVLENRSVYVRRAVMDRLRADGVDLPKLVA